MSTLDNQPTIPNERDNAGIEVLSENECMELLREVPVGRIGLTLNALPAVLPVNFAVLDGDIVIRTGGGTKLQAAMSNAVVAFETDGYDDEDQTGWSVMLTG